MRGLFHLMLAVAAGLVMGWVSAIGMMGSGGLTVVKGSPGWQERVVGPGQAVSPYAMAHFISEGSVPPSRNSKHFVRQEDDDGRSLSDGCVYELTGLLPKARWWTIAVASPTGARETLSAGEALLESDGRLALKLAPYPVAGNRIQSPRGSVLTLSITLHDLAPEEVIVLPAVKRSGC
jgi:hypothetical protein